MEKIIVTVNNSSNANLFTEFIKRLNFINGVKRVIEKKEKLPVNWAKDPDITALFGMSGKYKLNLTEIRKSWHKRT